MMDARKIEKNYEGNFRTRRGRIAVLMTVSPIYTRDFPKRFHTDSTLKNLNNPR